MIRRSRVAEERATGGMRSIFDGITKKKRFRNAIIVVSGLPRSGTSMMMNMLTAGGLEAVTDELREADDDNPRGYFEFERVKELDKDGDKSWIENARGKAIKVISSLLEELPETCHYKIIFMRRSIAEVIASQNTMLVRRGEPVNPAEDDRMRENYEKHLRKIEYFLGEQPHFDMIDVHYKEALENPAREAERIARFLGMELKIDDMCAAVDQQLYRNRR
jgi:hypothetical protein